MLQLIKLLRCNVKVISLRGIYLRIFCADNRTLVVVIVPSWHLAIDENGCFVLKFVGLELQCRDTVIEQIIELLDGEALHLRDG